MIIIIPSYATFLGVGLINGSAVRLIVGFLAPNNFSRISNHTDLSEPTLAVINLYYSTAV